MTQHWFERQLLIADVVDKAGWIPSAGGIGPYLSIRARIPAATRQDVDDAVFDRMELTRRMAHLGTSFRASVVAGPRPHLLLSS